MYTYVGNVISRRRRRLIMYSNIYIESNKNNRCSSAKNYRCTLMMRVAKLSRSLFTIFGRQDCKYFHTVKGYRTAVLPHYHFKWLKYLCTPTPTGRVAASLHLGPLVRRSFRPPLIAIYPMPSPNAITSPIYI